MDIVSIENLIKPKIDELKCEYETKSYIVGIFKKYEKSTSGLLLDDSLISLYNSARAQSNFRMFQDLGDFIFFMQTLFPAYLKNGSSDYFDTIARSSYFYCFKLLKRQWHVYEEMADDFVSLEKQTRKILSKTITF